MSDTSRDGSWLDEHYCCKLCDGEIPDGHTDNCALWQLEKKHRDFIANEYNAALSECDILRAELAQVKGAASLALEAAKAAILDAIMSEDGLDGETGTAVMAIITEWQERGTFDKNRCASFTSIEKRLADELEQVKAELDKAVARYEYVRRLNVPQFKSLFMKCVYEDKRFDDEVDAAMMENG